MRPLARWVFAQREDGRSSLSGKPVIITYLLNVVDELKVQGGNRQSADTQPISEWGIYSTIIEQLMLRDFRRTPELLPSRRKAFLQALAVFLGLREHRSIDSESFRALVRKELVDEIAKRTSVSHNKEDVVEQLVSDLRSSATLTREETRQGLSWRFSHNSLREFLLASLLIERLENGLSIDPSIPVTDAMRRFVVSMPAELLKTLFPRLPDAIVSGASRGSGVYVELLWDALLYSCKDEVSPHGTALSALTRGAFKFTGLSLRRLVLSEVSVPLSMVTADFRDCELSEVDFSGAALSGVDFTGGALDSCVFIDADVAGASFKRAIIIDCNLTGAQVKGADFREISLSDISIVEEGGGLDGRVSFLSGQAALGYLRFCGAMTDDVPFYWIVRNHPKFPIIAKICSKLTEQRNRQRRGLVQRGVANADPVLADELISAFENLGWVAESGARGLVGITELGRDELGPFVTEGNPHITPALQVVIERLLD